MNYLKKRKKLGLTQSDVAKYAGISLFAYQLIERRVTRNPRKETLKKIEAILKEDKK